MSSTDAPPELEIRLLGALEVARAGVPIALPRSKKTRALLAYLVMAGKPLRRDHLCSLLWDTTDDPRGALRWGLSKLRRVIDDKECITADREQVSFSPVGAHIDALELSAIVFRGVAEAPLAELEQVAGLARGEFLEGLELPDLFEFQAWSIAGRERAREARCELLAELVRRLREEPRRALPYARVRAQADGFNVEARRELLEILLRAGKRDEARQHYELSRRLFREVGVPGLVQLDRAWRSMSSDGGIHAPPVDKTPEADREEPATTRSPILPSEPPELAFIGRRKERERITALLEQVTTTGKQRVVLIQGEPGSGKSRLAEWLVERAAQMGVEVIGGRSYEAEGSRPFGPWVDALGDEMREFVEEPRKAGSPATRDGLFAAVARAAATRASSGLGVLLVLDDMQWMDRDSAELLHFVARTNQEHALFVVLLARSGELDDNEAALRALRGLRREDKIVSLDLEPLSVEEVGELVSLYHGADGDRIHDASAGNPLYALELARSAAAGTEATPTTLVRLVQERIERLPPQAAEVLGWAAVLGHAFEVSRLRVLSSLELSQLVEALGKLEQQNLLRSEASRSEDRYTFAHDVVREAVYGELSHPRRRLMHQQVARMLEPDSAASATEVAHHASLAGDSIVGVRACIEAGLRSLRIFANGEAETLALRGLELARELEESERIASTLELLHVRYSSRTPNREQAAAEVHELAVRALDLGLTKPARLGFQMLSYLCWESSSMADAHDNILQAERVSRTADPKERGAALAQAARCLVLLERNLGQAQAFVMEADLLAERGGRATSEVPFARAMLHEHRGELDEAAACFREARWLGREQGDRLAEFRAIEHWAMLEIDRESYGEALGLAKELVKLGGRVREGAEGPSGRALMGLVCRLHCESKPADELEAAIAELRRADAKYPLAFLMTRLAALELERGEIAPARQHAAAGLELAQAIGRVSEEILSRALLARCALLEGDRASAAQQIEALLPRRESELSVLARTRLEAVISDCLEDS